MKAAFFGTMGLDDISIASEWHKDVVGGSAAFGSLAAALFCNTTAISIVGKDFPKTFVKMMQKKGIDTSLLQKSNKPSFRWTVRYSSDLSEARTINREINSFNDFDPSLLKGKLKDVTAIFASKNEPALQAALFREVPKNAIKIMESRSHWITNHRDELKKVLEMTDVFMIHDEELKILAGENLSLPDMIESVMHLGPRVVVLLRGEHGLVMYGKLGTLIMPSYPLTFAVDPTGAGDVLGGTLAGVLGRAGKLTPATMRKALIFGNVVASFVVEDYGTRPIEELELFQVFNRTKLFMSQLPTAVDLHIDISGQ